MSDQTKQRNDSITPGHRVAKHLHTLNLDQHLPTAGSSTSLLYPTQPINSSPHFDFMNPQADFSNPKSASPDIFSPTQPNPNSYELRSTSFLPSMEAYPSHYVPHAGPPAGSPTAKHPLTGREDFEFATHQDLIKTSPMASQPSQPRKRTPIPISQPTTFPGEHPMGRNRKQDQAQIKGPGTSSQKLPAVIPPSTPPGQRRSVLGPRPREQIQDGAATVESPDPLSFSAGKLPSSITGPVGLYREESISPLKRKYDGETPVALGAPFGGDYETLRDAGPKLTSKPKSKPKPKQSAGTSASSRTTGNSSHQPHLDYVQIPSPSSTAFSGSQRGLHSQSKTVKTVKHVEYAVVTTGFASPESSDDESGDDFGTYVEEVLRTPGGSKRNRKNAAASSVKRTSIGTGLRGLYSSGGRAHNSQESLKSLQKFAEDIFEAEDSLSVDFSTDEFVHSRFFTLSSVDARQALLSAKMLSRLSRLISRCRRTHGMSLPSKGKTNGDDYTRLAEWPQDDLRRLLAMLDRSVIQVGELQMFPDDGYKASMNLISEGKSRGRPLKKKKKVAAEQKVDSATDKLPPAPEKSWVKQQHMVETMREALLAADALLNLLSADELPKPLYSEDQLGNCLTMIGNVVGDALMVVLEAFQSPSAISSTLLACLLSDRDDEQASEARQAIGTLIPITCTAIGRLSTLASSRNFALPEPLIVKAVYVCMKSLFASEILGDKDVTAALTPNFDEVLGGKSGVSALRRSTMNLLQALFAQNAEQRDWIVEEVLAALVKLSDVRRQQNQYRLKDGRHIHVLSALLLELVQSCGVNVEQHQLLINEGSSPTTEDAAPVPPTNVMHTTFAASTQAVDKANKVAMMISRHLLQKATSSSNARTKVVAEAEFKAILNVFVQDQLTVLYLPEWPAAALSLTMMTRLLKHTLDSEARKGEMTSARAIALEQLGAIGTKVREVALSAAANPESDLPSIEKIISEGQNEAFQRAQEAMLEVKGYLERASEASSTASSAANLSVNRWLSEIQSAVGKSEVSMGNPQGKSGEEEARKVTVIQQGRLFAAQLARPQENDSVFNEISSEDAKKAGAASLRLERSSTLQSAFSTILQAILTSLDHSTVAVRSRALRALQLIVTTDPDVLLLEPVKLSFEIRLGDTSPQVRDVALDLIGKYVLEKPSFGVTYYPLIANRVNDAGLGVRKHVIKILKGLYPLMTHEREIKVDICDRLVGMMGDEDDGVKDLAILTLSELWLTDPEEKTKSPRKVAAKNGPADSLQETVEIIVGVTDRRHHAIGPLAQVIKEITTACATSPFYQRLVNTMLDRFIQDQPISGIPPSTLVEAVHLFSQAAPELLTVQRASSLVPYLQSNGSNEALALTETLLRIFRLSIPHMPKTAKTFAQDLTKKILPVVTCPTRLSLQREAVACFATLVECLSQDHLRLVRILGSVDAKLRKFLEVVIKAGKEIDHQVVRQLPFLMTIEAGLVSYCDLDKAKQEKPDIVNDVEKITNGQVLDHVFRLLLQYSTLKLDSAVKTAVVNSLGTIFETHPIFLLKDEAMSFLDATFAQGAADKGTILSLLGVLQTILNGGPKTAADLEEGKGKKSAKKTEKGVDMAKLIGDTEGFAESGVHTALMQRYIGNVSQLVLLDDGRIQRVALDIISLTVAQGLTNPMQLVPVLVAVETCNDPFLIEKATQLHSQLNIRFPSIMNNRFTDVVRTAFHYQLTIREDAPGYRDTDPPEAMLDNWYGLVEKRAARLDFLKAVCRCLSFGEIVGVTRSDILLSRFVSDNLALLSYKTLEEVLQVLQQLTVVVSSLGAQVVDTMQSTTLSAGNESQMVITGELVQVDGDGDVNLTIAETMTPLALINAATMIGIILVLRNNLKSLYSIGEDKITKFTNAATNGRKIIPEFTKAVTRRIADVETGSRNGAKTGGDLIMDYSDLRLGLVQEIATVDQWLEARQNFLQLVQTDGTLDAFEEEEDDDDEE